MLVSLVPSRKGLLLTGMNQQVLNMFISGFFTGRWDCRHLPPGTIVAEVYRALKQKGYLQTLRPCKEINRAPEKQLANEPDTL